MKFILTRRFNYIDLVTNAMGVITITRGHLVSGIVIIIGGAIFSVVIELAYAHAKRDTKGM